MAISKIGILGAGAMGGGIAQVAAQSGFEVVLCDVEMSFVDRALAKMTAFLDKSIEKGRLTEEQKAESLSRITRTTSISDFNAADLVIEAIIEDLEQKKKAFSELEQVCKPGALLTSNTSSMSITVLAGATKRPELFAGMHFFNPPALMKLVEIIRGYYTSDETIAELDAVAKKMGKVTVEVKKDSPGFIVNRILIAQFAEAIRLLEEGVASPEDIDTAIKTGLNYPMGPFELQDFTGVDIAYFVMNYFYDEFKETRWNPPQAIKALIRAGRLGKKTGAGWYDH